MAAAAALLAVACLLGAPGAASASHRQVTLFADAGRLLTDPAGSLAQFRALGASTVRVVLQWQQVAPDPTATTIPAGFDGSDPDDYPAANWAPFDAIVQDAHQDGMAVDFTLAGGAPRWAQGAHIPPQGIADLSFAWKPNARLYGAFVHAVGVRYDGAFVPAGRVGAAARRPLLGPVERAQLRPGPGAAGDRRLHRVRRADDVPRPGRRGLDARCTRPATAATRS